MIATIIQCEKCRRYVADGDVHKFLAPTSGEYEAFKAAGYPQGDCGREDCTAQVQRNTAAEAAATARRIEYRKTHGSRGPRRGSMRPRPAVATRGRECRMPYKDDGERFESPAAPGTVTAPELPQHEFESSGAADAQNNILIEFFTDPKTDGKWFPMGFLCELCGGHHMNNRMIDLRRHFAPMGFGFWNEMRQSDGIGPMLSQYKKLPLAEVQRLEREREADRERRRAEREGQKTF